MMTCALNMINKLRLCLSLAKKDMLFLWALLERRVRGNSGEREVVLFGHPIISLAYVGHAIRRGGYVTTVIVPGVYAINKASDFDMVAPSPLAFYRKVVSASVWVYYFDSFDCFFGFLRYCPGLVRRMVGARFVVMPYGADAMEYQKVSDLTLRHALMLSYPNTVQREAKVRRSVERLTGASDVVVGCISHTFNLLKWDVLPVHYYPIDLEKVDRLKPGVVKHDVFTVAHSPNHRGVKGTHLILQAIDELQAEGVSVRLSLIERSSNEDVIRQLHASHLLIDQVIGGGYALSAMEGMACGIPVVAHISKEVAEVFEIYSYLNHCPIVSCERTVASIKAAILRAMHDHEQLSSASRQYVETFHSVEALTQLWAAICDRNRTEDLMNFYLERP